MMDEDELDPRIQVELEKLNSATDVINKLEIELDEANTTFRMLLNECTRRLKVHSSKHGSAIENARPYYEALDIARQAQQDCQQAAVSFQRANEVHEAAKETVALAESRFMSQQPEWRFDSAWQEMLNHATLKVRDAEKQRAESSAYHGHATARYKDAQEKVHLLEQRLRRNVAKSRPYFEEKQRCNEQLAAQKEAVETLAAKVARIKSEYAASLRRLEGISEEIHRKRGNMQMVGCGVREPGVGAELEYTGEQTHCDTSRDTTSYNYDAKFNANNLPDNNKNSSANHSKDCQEVLEVDVRRVVGEFQPCDETKIPAVQSKLDTGCNVPRETMPDNQTRRESKISFESLHALHFNPIKDVGLHCDDSECESENETSRPTDVSMDLIPEFVCSPAETSLSISQGKYGLVANRRLYGEVVTIEQGVRDDGAKDSNFDIREEVEDDSTKNVIYCYVKSEMDVETACDQLVEMKLGEEGTGAISEDVDIIKVATGVEKDGVASSEVCAVGDADGVANSGVCARGDVDGVTTSDICAQGDADGAVTSDLCAQGDAGWTPGSSKNEVPDNHRQKQADVGSGSEDSMLDSECSNTRQPDLEITFQHRKSQHKNNDENEALESIANTLGENQDCGLRAGLQDVSN